MDMVQAELLTETTEFHFKRMLSNPDFGFQEKHNGSRLMLAKQNGTLRCFNREGNVSSKPLPIQVRHALMAHPLSTFVLDGELVGTTFFIFDALILDDEVLNHDSYEYREARYHTLFTATKHMVPVKTARSMEEKRALWTQVVGYKGEGLVSKDMRKAYSTGRSGQHFKLKFVKECDVVVIGMNPEGKDSIEIGMYDDNGRLHRVSGCSLRGKFHPAPQEVVEVRFLYATEKYHIVQPVLMRLRHDKKASECRLSQLKLHINKNWSTHLKGK